MKLRWCCALAAVTTACSGEIGELEGAVDLEETSDAVVGTRWCASLEGSRACCPSGYVLRPEHGVCTPTRDLSPNLDRAMTYRDRSSNFLPVGDDTLELVAAHVIDNGEGTDWPHGPLGHVYFDFASCEEYLPLPPDGADRRLIAAPRLLQGPHRSHGTTDEWNDDEYLRFEGAGLLSWGRRSCVTLRVWERDGTELGPLDFPGGGEDGGFGRRNDVLGMERVLRAPTVGPDGVWIDLHKYTNDHPRRRTGQVAVRLQLRTRRACSGCARPETPRGVLLCVDRGYARCNFVDHACPDLARHHGATNGQYLGDKISSVRLIGVPSVTLYEHDHHRGRSVVLTRDAPDLNASSLRFGDIASSLRL